MAIILGNEMVTEIEVLRSIRDFCAQLERCPASQFQAVLARARAFHLAVRDQIAPARAVPSDGASSEDTAALDEVVRAAWDAALVRIEEIALRRHDATRS
jgi:hypothetical protein